MTVDWTHELVEQLDFHWQRLFPSRLESLTDEEYLWEPVEGCWSVRPRGDGAFALERASPEPDPPPFTTIAWRMCHIGGPVLGQRASNHFGDGSFNADEVGWPGTAADGIAFVEQAYADWKAGVEALDDEGLARPCGPAEGPFSEHPFAALVLHINREAIHHLAEVCCLRDLYRNRPQP